MLDKPTLAPISKHVPEDTLPIKLGFVEVCRSAKPGEIDKTSLVATSFLTVSLLRPRILRVKERGKKLVFGIGLSHREKRGDVSLIFRELSANISENTELVPKCRLLEIISFFENP